MEGASQLGSVREIWGCLPEYWETGKPRLEADVRAACEGLVAGGASEVVVLDNHGGNTVNVSPEVLPEGARLETWRDFDLAEHGVEATFQVGYHARGGVNGFLSHTYVPGLRLRVEGELVSESHGRTWASGLPLLGITGNDSHQATLGSLADIPYLAVQRSVGRDAMQPLLINRLGWRRFGLSRSSACATPTVCRLLLRRLMFSLRRLCRTAMQSSTRWSLLAGLALERWPTARVSQRGEMPESCSPPR